VEALGLSDARAALRLLSKEELGSWLEEGEPFASGLGLELDADDLDEHMRWVFGEKIQNMEKGPGSEIWRSYFAIVVEGRVVGAIGPKGRPDAAGAIEIGYGIGEKYRNRGTPPRRGCSRRTAS
jgi:RimJ/RimL family protein N-acetyltransferase